MERINGIIKKSIPSFKRRHWSFVADIKAGDKKLFLKIPKMEMDLSLKKSMNRKKNIEQGIIEARNHKKAERIKFSKGFKVTKLREYVKKYNCLVFDFVEGNNLYKVTLNNNLIRDQNLERVFKIIGKNLHIMHRIQVSKKNSKTVAEEIMRYSKSLKLHIDKRVIHYSKKQIVKCALSAEGFEIRNFITNNRCIYFFDIGELKEAPVYENLARFIVSSKIIYWNKLLFLARLKINKAYKKSFLKGYGQKENEPMLQIFILKELLRFYYHAILSLNHRVKTRSMRKLIKRCYIDRFYKREVNKCQEKIINLIT